ncbi:MAG: hypothetical protein WBA74_20150 [Cyclobacteriaceae bacterium]
MEVYQINRYNSVAGILVAILICLVNQQSLAQKTDNEIFIYGEIQTIDNVYKGYLRWGKEEVYWFDYFNASKVDNDYYRAKRNTKENSNTNWLDIDWNLSSIWEDKNNLMRHEFTCQFGDISEITFGGSNRALVKLKNNVEIKVDGSGYNDMGGYITIIDEEIGKINLRWNKLNKVIFKPANTQNNETFGQPLYGTVKTYRKGNFTGYIQWDHDERISSDKLDGDSSDGDVSIAMGKIKTIEKSGRGSNVYLQSGREFYLTNSNDVNTENRGIIVMIEGIGEVDIPWRDFESVKFSTPGNHQFSYNDYKIPDGISGKVFLHDNSTLSGRIIYDIDEVWELETLEANDDNIKYRIPIRNIQKIKPKNFDYSLVTLKNNEQLLIGGKRDVSDKNDGLLIIEERGNEPIYVPWKNVSEIIFN